MNSFSTDKLRKRNCFKPIKNCFLFQLFNPRKIHAENSWKKLVKTFDEFVKNCSRKILVWWCGQLKRVTFFPVSSCQLHVRKREEKKKKITALQLLCVCVYFTIETKKRHLSSRRVRERATVAALFLQFWCYTL